MEYAELHCHSYYSFHDGASSLEELRVRARELGYRALAVTDHDNLCGAMCFAQLAASLEMKGIIGAELTISPKYHSEPFSSHSGPSPCHSERSEESRSIIGENSPSVISHPGSLPDDSGRIEGDSSVVPIRYVHTKLPQNDRGGVIPVRSGGGGHHGAGGRATVYHLPLLAENRNGYGNLSRLITAGPASAQRN